MTDFFADKARTWNEHPFKMRMVQQFFNYVTSNIAFSRDSVVLDFGCGTGLIGFSLMDLCRKVVFVDNSPAMLEVLTEKLQEQNCAVDRFAVHAGDINTYSDERVDIVVSNMVLHHCEDIESAIKGCFESLKANGKVVMVDLKSEDGSFHAPEVVPHNGFETIALKRLFEKVGFRNVLIENFDPMRKGDRTYERWVLVADK